MAYVMTKSKSEFGFRNIYINLLIFAMLFNGGMIPTYIVVRNLENLTELSNRNLNAAKIVVAVVPLLIIYPFLQKCLISGMTVGAVKE